MIFFKQVYTYIILILIFSAISCKRDNSYIADGGIVWNTTYRILYDSNTSLTDSILATLKNVDNSVSAFNDSSIVSKINRNEKHIIDSHFRKLYELSYNLNKTTYGAFDPTISPLINAWGFGYEDLNNTKQINIDSLLNFVGIEKTTLNDDSLIKSDSRTSFNFSAIAKGYGCDVVGEMFKRNGIENYMIEIGGEIVVAGVNPHGGKWRISIDRPIIDNKNIIHQTQTIIEISDAALATSGNYRNYKEIDGIRIAHTISPKTGKPIQTEIVSATIIASSCAIADAYATACMASDLKTAKRIITDNNLIALLLLDDGTSWQSQNFNSLIVK